MALTTCYECGGKVSTRAAACPHCAAPLGGKIRISNKWMTLNAISQIFGIRTTPTRIAFVLILIFSGALFQLFRQPETNEIREISARNSLTSNEVSRQSSNAPMKPAEGLTKASSEDDTFYTFSRIYKSLNVLSTLTPQNAGEAEPFFSQSVLSRITGALETAKCNEGCIIDEFELRNIDLNDDREPEYLVNVQDSKVIPDALLFRSGNDWKNLIPTSTGRVYVERQKTNGFYNIAVIGDKSSSAPSSYRITRLSWNGFEYVPSSASREVLAFYVLNKWYKGPFETGNYNREPPADDRQPRTQIKP
jgi:hypothetical protein